jgi:diguanylate cyclase (GGDEF)-like protein
MDRRGSMYDPLIVDTFAKVHSIAPKESLRKGPPSEVLNTIAHLRRAPNAEREFATLDEITASADEMLSVYELAQSLAGHVSISDAGDVIAKHLRRLIPSSLCVFYLYDRVADELDARHVVGDGTSLIRGLRISLGQRLSGWVAANRQTISNSDASLDLGEVARSAALRLRSCISTPLVSSGDLVGVLSLYSTKSNGFNDDHRRIIEVVARQIAHTFARAIEFDSLSRRDSLTGLPPVEQLEKVLQAALQNEVAPSGRHALLFVEVPDLKAINVKHGRSAGDEVLRHVVRHSRAGLRVADILFRNTGDDFVALLSATDGETAEIVAERVRQRISKNPVQVGSGISLTIQANVIAVASPRDGECVKDLLSAARQRRADHHAPHSNPSAIIH